MGGPVGRVWTGSGILPARRYDRLHDYRVEHIILGGEFPSNHGRSETGIPRWRQQVQYAVGHTLNDFYSLEPDVRRQTPIQFLLERRWPPKEGAFPSLLHYWDIKTKIADELMRIVSGNRLQEIPVMLYEQWFVPVPELGIELSVIFQLGWGSEIKGRSLNIQKFMVKGNEEVITSFMHMVNVFCHQAYGEPPESVEIYSLMDGRNYCYDGSTVPLQDSLDYVRLLSVFLESNLSESHSSGCIQRRNKKGEEQYNGGIRLM